MKRVKNAIPSIQDYSSDKFYETLEEMANLGTYSVDIQKQTWVGSANFIRMFGLPKKDEYTTKEFEMLVHPDDHDWLMDFYAECIQKRKDFNCQYRCIKKDGTVIHVHSRSKIFYDTEGVPYKTFGLKQDITEQKKTKESLERLNQLNKERISLLGEVAHDLRNPIAAVKGVLSLLKPDADENNAELIEEADQRLDFMNEFVNELLVLSNSDVQSPALHLTEIKVATLFQEIEKLYQTKVKANKQNFLVSVSDELTLQGDRAKIQRILENLVGNAIKFTPDGGKIWLEAYQEEDSVTFIVGDDGLGIKKSELPFIFTSDVHRFKRPGLKGEPTFGLGLQIVKSIVDLHKGAIEVKSSQGKGTEFTIRLPVRSSAP